MSLLLGKKGKDTGRSFCTATLSLGRSCLFILCVMMQYNVVPNANKLLLQKEELVETEEVKSLKSDLIPCYVELTRLKVIVDDILVTKDIFEACIACILFG
jgi:hypothetical protein